MDYSNNLIELVIKISRALKGKMVFDDQTSHLTMLQLQALVLLKNEDNIQMKDIADNFKVKMSTATSLLDRLVSAKLVSRREDSKDRRIVRISLTNKGKTLIDNAMEQRKRKINTVLSYISLKDKKSLLRILQTISKRVENEYEKTT